MNERIRALAKKSGFSLDSTGIYTAKLEHLPITDNMEKFAELIIQECINVVDYDDGATHVRELLLEHFGVE